MRSFILCASQFARAFYYVRQSHQQVARATPVSQQDRSAGVGNLLLVGRFIFSSRCACSPCGSGGLCRRATGYKRSVPVRTYGRDDGINIEGAGDLTAYLDSEIGIFRAIQASFWLINRPETSTYFRHLAPDHFASRTIPPLECAKYWT